MGKKFTGQASEDTTAIDTDLISIRTPDNDTALVLNSSSPTPANAPSSAEVATVPRVVLGSIASADLSQPDANAPVSDSALVFDPQSGDIVSSGILAISSADSLPSSSDGILNSPTPTNLRITDIIPFSDSGESGQNSEPSLGVNPANPALNQAQMIGGAFSFSGGSFFALYFKSTDGGVTWSDYGSVPSFDKTIAWKQDGSSVLTASITSANTIQTFSGTAADSSFGSAINTFSGRFIDQPWMRTGPSNQV